jgi:hypothetical protein
MDEEDVRQDEQAWVKSFFTIDTEPSSDLVQAAVRRQKIRTGFSEWEYKHADQDGPKK